MKHLIVIIIQSSAHHKTGCQTASHDSYRIPDYACALRLVDKAGVDKCCWDLAQSPAEEDDNNHQEIGICEKRQYRHVSTKKIINTRLHYEYTHIKTRVHNPIVLHLKSVDLHVLYQSLLLLHNYWVEKQRHAQTQQERIDCVSNAINDFTHLLQEVRLEWHELLSRDDKGVVKNAPYICLVHLISQTHRSFHWSCDMSSCTSICLGCIIVFWLVHNPNLCYPVISMVLVILIVVYLKFVCKFVTVRFFHLNYTVRNVLRTRHR